PRPERRPPLGGRPPPPGQQEGLLDQVLRVLEGPQHPVAVHLQLTPVAVGQVRERRLVTAARGGHHLGLLLHRTSSSGPSSRYDGACAAAGRTGRGWWPRPPATSTPSAGSPSGTATSCTSTATACSATSRTPRTSCRRSWCARGGPATASPGLGSAPGCTRSPRTPAS